MKRTKLDEWAAQGLAYGYDLTLFEAYKIGARDMRTKINLLVDLVDKANTDNIKNNPELASYILLELKTKIETFGDEDEQ